MSVSLRDQRGRIYGYEANASGGAVGGWAQDRYPFVAERWCRLETPSGRDVALAAQSEQQLDAVLAFADEVTIPANSVVTVEGRAYKVTAVLPVRLMRELRVFAVYADDAEYTLVDP